FLGFDRLESRETSGSKTRSVGRGRGRGRSRRTPAPLSAAYHDGVVTGDGPSLTAGGPDVAPLRDAGTARRVQTSSPRRAALPRQALQSAGRAPAGRPAGGRPGSKSRAREPGAGTSAVVRRTAHRRRSVPPPPPPAPGRSGRAPCGTCPRRGSDRAARAAARPPSSRSIANTTPDGASGPSEATGRNS